MAHTDSYVEIAQTIKDLLESNKTTLGLQNVYYGDVGSLAPTTPYACVEPSIKERTLEGAAGPSGQTLNTIDVVIMLYHGPVNSPQVSRKECDEFAEAVETYLHSDVRLGGIVIHGFVVTMESGQAAVASAVFQATRMTWRGMTKTLL